MAHQISIFAENKPGRIEKITRILEEAEVNIRAITISGSDTYGVIKLLVDKPEEAYRHLAAAGVSVFKREIVAVLMDDRPGGLHRVTEILGQAGINIEDAYGFVIEDRKRAILVMEVDRVEIVQDLLARHGLKTLSDGEIYSL
jgi:hypothetical protein